MKNWAKRTFGWFTLVELIVTLSVLAVLSAIGFLSLSGYSQDSKDASVKANVRSVYTAISSESAITWKSPRYYVAHDPNYALSGGAIIVFDGAPATLTWGDWSVAWTNYSAGNPDYVRLKLNKEKFKVSAFLKYADAYASADASYMLVGAVDLAWSSSKSRTRSYLQTAAVNKLGIAFVTGDYPTALSGSVSWLVRDVSWTSSTWALIEGTKAGFAPGCPAQTSSGYSVPALSSGQSQTVSKTVSNGSLSSTASCNMGAFFLGSESVSCDSGYVPSGLTCISDVCQSTVPANGTSNATSQSVTGTWQYSATPGQCTFACVSGYAWNGSACAPVVNWACGTSASAQPWAPAASLCSSGTASAVSGIGPWTWSCAGANGGSTASCTATIDSALIGYWDMQTVCVSWSCGAGNDGKLRDFSSKGNHGACTDNSVAYSCGTAGKWPQISGWAMTFSSGSDTKIVAGTGGLSVNFPITIVLKAKFFGFSNQNGLVFINNDTCNRYLFSSTWTPNGTFDWFHTGTCNSTGGWGVATGENVSYFSPNTWYVISYVVNPMAGYVNVYRNNSLIQTATFAPFSSFNGIPKNVWIGGNNESVAYTTNGIIDEVRLFNRELTSPELASAYQMLQ